MKIDITKNYIRKRLMSPGVCDKRSFRVKDLKGGKKLVICCAKGEWDPKRKKCRIGTRAQSLLTPRKKGKKAKR